MGLDGGTIVTRTDVLRGSSCYGFIAFFEQLAAPASPNPPSAIRAAVSRAQAQERTGGEGRGVQAPAARIAAVRSGIVGSTLATKQPIPVRDTAAGPGPGAWRRSLDSYADKLAGLKACMHDIQKRITQADEARAHVVSGLIAGET